MKSAAERGRYDAFLSYSRKDSAVAERVRETLEACGVRVFQDSSIQPGDEWVDVLESAIQQSGVFLALVSEHWSSSKWGSREMRMALVEERGGRHLPTIPIWLGGTLPGFLGIYQAVDIRPPIGPTDFTARVEGLAHAILEEVPPRFAGTVLEELSFLSLFPQGMAKPVYRWLIEKRGLQTTVDTETARFVLAARDVEGIEFVGLKLETLPAARSVLTDPAAQARGTLEDIEELIRTQELYASEGGLSLGLILLLRDELRVLRDHSSDDENWIDLIEDISWRTRRELPGLLLGSAPGPEETTTRLPAGGRLVLALQILRLLDQVSDLNPTERLERARLNLAIGAPDRALDLYATCGADRLFERLPRAEDRIAAIQDWAKASKDADRGFELHDRLVAGYRTALELVDDAYASERDRDLVRADLLGNRATQLSIFGKEPGDRAQALEDLAVAAEIYERLGDDEAQLELGAERLSLALYPAAGEEPLDLLAEIERLEPLARKLSARFGVFFFFYMKGTILARENRPEEAVRAFETSETAARLAGLENRALLAEWKALRYRYAVREITAPEFLDSLEACKNRLLEHQGDAWCSNALLKILIDDVKDTSLALDRPDRALSATAQAFDLAARRAEGGSAAALRRLQRMRDCLVDLEPSPEWSDSFIEERRSRLARVMEKKDYEITWGALKDWEEKKERK